MPGDLSHPHGSSQHWEQGVDDTQLCYEAFLDRTFGGGCVLIDEISFMSLDLLAALEHLRLKGVRLITFGDWGQLGPVSNR